MHFSYSLDPIETTLSLPGCLLFEHPRTSHFLERVCCGKLPDPNELRTRSALDRRRLGWWRSTVLLQPSRCCPQLSFWLGSLDPFWFYLHPRLAFLGCFSGTFWRSSRAHISALRLVIVGFSFNLGHLRIQASPPWLLLWYWRCPRAPSTGDTLHTGALLSALGRWNLRQ